MKYLILILTALCSLHLFAEEKAITFGPAEGGAIAEKPLLIYFGGVGATANDMKAFEKQAKRNSKVGGIYEIKTVGWPGGSNRRGGPSSTAEGRKIVAHYAALIAAHPEREFVIVGHSAGSDMLNAIVDAIRPPPGRTRIPNLKVVNLDGFHPSSNQGRKAEQICWSVRGNSNGTSPGFSYLADKSISNCSSFHVAKSSSCGNMRSPKWCLHTQIVNRNGQSVGAVYADLKANFDWVPKLEVAQKSMTTDTANEKGANASR